jgi:hypothetical protein
VSIVFAPLTIENIVDLLPGVSERALRETIRKLGCYSLIGGKMYLELSDFKQLLRETKPCRSGSDGETGSPSSTAPLEVNAYEKALALATRKSQKVSEPKKRRVSGGRRPTASRTKQPSLTLVSST